MLAVGIDPSSGARSNIGYAIVDVENKRLILAKELTIPRSTDLRARIKGICAALAAEFKQLPSLDDDCMMFIESTVMMGKGGESLQRTIGAILAISPSSIPVEHVSNMQVKAFVGGTGRADKKEVAEGIHKFLNDKDIIFSLISAKRFDALDAIAIALTGYEKYVSKNGLPTARTK